MSSERVGIRDKATGDEAAGMTALCWGCEQAVTVGGDLCSECRERDDYKRFVDYGQGRYYADEGEDERWFVYREPSDPAALPAAVIGPVSRRAARSAADTLTP